MLDGFKKVSDRDKKIPEGVVSINSRKYATIPAWAVSQIDKPRVNVWKDENGERIALEFVENGDLSLMRHSGLGRVSLGGTFSKLDRDPPDELKHFKAELDKDEMVLVIYLDEEVEKK